MTNYRSFQEIINAAESVLVSVNYRDSNKHGKCSSGFGGKVDLVKENDSNKVCERLYELWEEYQLLPKEEKYERKKKGECFVLVLSRSNDALKNLKTILLATLNRKSLPEHAIRFETFHRSKGLEADYCVLLDDCVYNNHFPVKNFIYAATDNFKQTYDEAQRDEAMRLAYVAITRAKQQCWWYGIPRDGGAIQCLSDYLSKESGAIKNTAI